MGLNYKSKKTLYALSDFLFCFWTVRQGFERHVYCAIKSLAGGAETAPFRALTVLERDTRTWRR